MNCLGNSEHKSQNSVLFVAVKLRSTPQRIKKKYIVGNTFTFPLQIQSKLIFFILKLFNNGNEPSCFDLTQALHSEFLLTPPVNHTRDVQNKRTSFIPKIGLNPTQEFNTKHNIPLKTNILNLQQ